MMMLHLVIIWMCSVNYDTLSFWMDYADKAHFIRCFHFLQCHYCWPVLITIFMYVIVTPFWVHNTVLE